MREGAEHFRIIFSSRLFSFTYLLRGVFFFREIVDPRKADFVTLATRN